MILIIVNIVFVMMICGMLSAYCKKMRAHRETKIKYAIVRALARKQLEYPILRQVVASFYGKPVQLSIGRILYQMEQEGILKQFQGKAQTKGNYTVIPTMYQLIK